MKARTLLFSIVCMGWFVGICGQEQSMPRKSFIYKQLERLAQSRPVREIALLKDLPQAINRCYITKAGCSEQDKKVIKHAMITIPVLMATFATLTGIALKKLPGKDQRARYDYESLTVQNRSALESNLITAINKGDKKYLVNIMGQVQFPQRLLNSFLQLAVSSANEDIVDFLIKQGAQATARDGKGNTFLYWAAYRSTFGPAEYGTAKKIIALLLKHNASVNLPGEGGKTPLMFVAGAGRDDLVKLFLQKNADPTIKDDENKTALDYVTMGEEQLLSTPQTKAIRALLEQAESRKQKPFKL